MTSRPITSNTSQRCKITISSHYWSKSFISRNWQKQTLKLFNLRGRKKKPHYHSQSHLKYARVFYGDRSSLSQLRSSRWFVSWDGYQTNKWSRKNGLTSHQRFCKRCQWRLFWSLISRRCRYSQTTITQSYSDSSSTSNHSGTYKLQSVMPTTAMSKNWQKRCKKARLKRSSLRLTSFLFLKTLATRAWSNAFWARLNRFSVRWSPNSWLV